MFSKIVFSVLLAQISGNNWLFLIISAGILILWIVLRARRSRDVEWLIRKRDADSLERLLEEKPELIHFRTSYGATLLHLAAYNGDIRLLQVLFKNGCDASATDGKGGTPLDLASVLRNHDAARLLFEYQTRSGVPEIFISYKSKNVAIARRIAEHCISSGRRVWFAEYEILLEARNKFIAAIDEGINQCSSAIIVIDRSYLCSRQCIREILQLIDLDKRIVLVCMPDIFDYVSMYDSVSIEEALRNYRKENNELDEDYINKYGHQLILAPESIQNLVNEHDKITFGAKPVEDLLLQIDDRFKLTHISEQQMRADSEHFVEGSMDEAKFAFDAGGWHIGAEDVRNSQKIGSGTELFYNSDKVKLAINIHFDFDTSTDGENRLQESGEDERKLYDFLLKYSKRHINNLCRLSDSEALVRGVHLLFCGGYSQIGLTYHWQDYWTRKYSITLLHPLKHVPVEFVFTCGCEGSFQKLCEYGYVFDRLVSSLKWKNRT